MQHFLKIVTIVIFSISCDRLSVDLFPVMTDEGTYMYIDKDGKIVINPQFIEAGTFIDGIALVKAESTGGSGIDAYSMAIDTTTDMSDEEVESVPLYGYIKKDGTYLFPPSFVRATIFSEKKSWVVKENGAPEAIDNKGNVLFTLKDAENVQIFRNGLAGFSTLNKEGQELWGFVNKKGEVVINPQFYQVGNCSSKLCPVKNKKGKWGYVDLKGNIAINYQFSSAQSFVNNVATVQLGRKVGLIDKDGKFLINPQFSEIIIDDDKLLVRSNDMYGWTDMEGTYLINPQFDFALPFYGNDQAPVQTGDSWGYIDSEGKYVINPQFEAGLPFYDGRAIVKSSDLFGIISKDGKYVVNPQFEGFSSDFVINLASNFRNTELGVIQTDYFNLDALLTTISFAQPEGLNVNGSFREVAEKFGLSQNSFQSYRDSKYLVSNKKITNDISYDFIVLGSPFEIEDGWSYSYRYNQNLRVSGFEYRISLFRKGNGKQESVLKAITGKLNDYERIYDSKSRIIYSKNDRHVILQLYYNEIRIVIMPGPHDNYGVNDDTNYEESTSDTIAADTAGYDQ